MGDLFRTEVLQAQRGQWMGAVNLAAPLSFVWWSSLRSFTYQPLRPAQEDQFVYAARQQTELLEAIRGAPILKLFNQQQPRTARYANAVVETVNRNIAMQRLNIAFTSAVQRPETPHPARPRALPQTRAVGAGRKRPAISVSNANGQTMRRESPADHPHRDAPPSRDASAQRVLLVANGAVQPVPTIHPREVEVAG